MKTKGRRISANLVDNSGPKGRTKFALEEGHRRQIFDPNLSQHLTYIKNKVANANRLANKGKGAQALKAAPKTVLSKMIPTKNFKKGQKATKKGFN